MGPSFHYHFHWLPSRAFLAQHLPTCASDCNEGQAHITTARGGEARMERCPDCGGTGFDPEPCCGDCGEPLDPALDPVGALVEAKHTRGLGWGCWAERWSYLLCGACAWSETVSDDGGSATITAEPSN
jgi:hypothetical protein